MTAYMRCAAQGLQGMQCPDARQHIAAAVGHLRLHTRALACVCACVEHERRRQGWAMSMADCLRCPAAGCCADQIVPDVRYLPTRTVAHAPRC